MSTAHTNAPSQSISKAKRAFLLNLALCVLLGTGYLVLRLSSPSDVKITQHDLPTPPTQEIRSALEQASLEGQAHGLSEDPKSYAPLIRRRLTRAAEVAIDSIEQNRTSIDNCDRDTLIAAYVDGYHARFKDYYSERDGDEAGIRYGLKLNPTIHPMFSRISLINELEQNKAVAQEKYGPLDETQWIIFKNGFDKGYESSYIRIKKGVTVKRGEPIRLFEP